MRIKNFIKKNYKVVILIIIGFVLTGVAVYAEETLKSSNVAYNNKTSNLTSTNMQGAIDELNNKANALASSKPCRVIKGTGTNTSDEIKCGTEEFYVLYTSGDSITVLTKYPIEGGHASFNINGHEMNNIVEIENPSYAQNKNCGSNNFFCGGTGFSTKYKEVLNKIGLSSDIEVIKPSLSELNKSGCTFEVPPSYYTGSDFGNCKLLPWLSNVAVSDTIQGPVVLAVASSDGIDGLAQLNNNYGEDIYEKLMIKIPIKNILM